MQRDGENQFANFQSEEVTAVDLMATLEQALNQADALGLTWVAIDISHAQNRLRDAMAKGDL